MGEYQNIDTITPYSINPSTFSHTTVFQTATPAGRLPTETRRARTAENSTLVTIASRKTPSGTTTKAVRSLDATVIPSDTGRDFQNRMLRSLRSAYRQS